MMSYWQDLGLAGLFLISFFASTVIPVSSEPVFFAFLVGGFDPMACLLWASAGNVLGGGTCLALGWYGNSQRIRRWLGTPDPGSWKYAARVKKWGWPLAFFSFLPLVGDAILVALGFFRISPYKSVIMMMLGKVLRYIFLLYAGGFF